MSYQEGPKTGPSDAPRVTVFTSFKAPLCKSFTLQDGKVHKTTLAILYAGNAATIEVGTATALNAALDGLSHYQAIATGLLKAGDSATIGSASQGAATTRSLDNFTHVTQPGWLLWDYDAKSMPPEVSARVAELGRPLEAFFHIWPEARNAAHLIRPSSSDGITAPGQEPSKSEGLHGFFLVQDVSQSKAILETLEQRAWAAGLAWIALSKSGAMLNRSIVDTAVGSPERLIFEAPPILKDGITRQHRAPIISEGVAVAAPALPLEMATAAESLRNDARRAIKSEAERVEGAFLESRAQAVVAKTGKPIEDARKSIAQMMRGAMLSDDHLLQMNSGVWVRVGDLLDAGAKHDRLSMPDPIEGIAYGKDNATLLMKPRARRPDDKPRLISHAHGATTIYTFERYGLPKAAELKSGRSVDLRVAVATGEMPQIVAVAHKLAQRVPHRMSVDDVVSFCEAETMPLIRERVKWIVGERKKKVLERTALPSRKMSHNYHKVSKLEPLTGEGVFIVKAPMGSGKTQIIGKALNADMAICHRITLVSELSRRLGLPHYQSAFGEDRVAVCLPSVVKFEYLQPEVLFVDEIAQCLRFLESRLCDEKIYKTFARLIRDAKTVVVADAHADPMTLEFIERCRPKGERFTIIEMDAQATEKRAEIVQGPDAVLEALTEELLGGGKVWLATEGARTAEGIGAKFSAEGFRVMTVTARTKIEGDVEAFLKDPEAEADNYDLIVASPAISSGLSIQTGAFTLGAFIGSGAAIRPEDAAQMMSRVRYLKRFIICIQSTNLAGVGGLTAEALRSGIEGLAGMAPEAREWAGYDTFCVHVKADNVNARAEFGAGLYWMLEQEGWELRLRVSRSRVDFERKMTAEATKEAKEAHARNVVTAGLPDVPELLEGRSVLTAEQQLQLEAFRVDREFGRLTCEDAEDWDNGRARQVRERFEDLVGVGEVKDESAAPLSKRAFRAERRVLIKELFDGVDLRAHLTKEVCAMMLDRIMRRPGVYAAAGIVGKKYAVRWGKKLSKPKYPVGEISAVLLRFGLKTERAKSGPQSPLLVTKRGSSGPKDTRDRGLEITGWARMEEWLERRAERAAAEADKAQFVWPADDARSQWYRPRATVMGWFCPQNPPPRGHISRPIDMRAEAVAGVRSG